MADVQYFGGLDIGSVNCAAAIIGVGGHEQPPYDLEVRMEDSLYVAVANGIKSTPRNKADGALKLVGLLDRREVLLAGVEDFTNQPASFTAFSIGEMNGYVRNQLMLMGMEAVLVAPSLLNALCGANKKRMKRDDRKVAIRTYLVEHCDFNVTGGTSKEREQRIDAFGYAWMAFWCMQAKLGKWELVSKYLGSKTSLFHRYGLSGCLFWF